MSHRRACDRCYKYKEKCSFEDGANACALCVYSSSTCTTTRLQRRQGRRPGLKRLGPQGSFYIWQMSDESSTPRAVAGERSAKSVVQPASPVASETGGSSSSIYLLRPAQNETSNTDKSQISTVICVNRPIPSVSENTRSNNLSISQSSIQNLQRHQVGFAEQVFNPASPSRLRHYYKSFDWFILGPTFAPKVRATFQHCYMCSPMLLHDIFMAIIEAVNWARHTAREHQLGTTRGANSLQKLRAAKIHGIQDAFAILVLGQTLAAFDFLSNCNNANLILQYTLSSIKSWYSELSMNSLLDPVTISPIFWDTIACLLKREVPIIKYALRDLPIVDHSAGVCTTLLPILYDLCVISHTLKSHLQFSSEIHTESVRQIEQRLLSWKPDHPPDLSSIFSREEILAIEVQASMYKTTGLLIAHRTLHPIGTLDEVARSYADSIMHEFVHFLASTTSGTRLHNVSFPILIAMLEIPNVSKDIWNCTTLGTAAPASVAKISALIDYVWMKRDCGSTSFIFDLVDDGPAIAVFT